MLGNPREGLPNEIFQFISQMPPRVNVGLLITHEPGHCLLTWCENGFSGPG